MSFNFRSGLGWVGLRWVDSTEMLFPTCTIYSDSGQHTAVYMAKLIAFRPDQVYEIFEEVLKAFSHDLEGPHVSS